MTRPAGRREEWLPARKARPLIAAALAVPLLLGGAFLSVGRLHSSPSDVLDHPLTPVSDDQSQAQVLEPAKQVVAIAGLRTTNAGYLLMSCKDRENPPYQGAIYLTFALPAETRPDLYFPTIAEALVAHGWTEGLPPNDHVFGRTLTKDAVTAITYPQRDDKSVGVLRLYGACWNMTDHRRDATAWVDITGQLKP
jgi:hypothetical protein